VPTAAVVIFCGPHDEGELVPTRRIDHAITTGLSRGLPLIIAGDAFHGQEVSRFQARAWHAGVEAAYGAYDQRHSTLSDAQAVATVIRQHFTDPLARFCRVHLVTDWWHMRRARTMLVEELKGVLHHPIEVLATPVMIGPRPCEEVFVNEQQGLEDYLAGVYGQRRVIDPLCHSPDDNPHPSL
jgi:hypothetical protein